MVGPCRALRRARLTAGGAILAWHGTELPLGCHPFSSTVRLFRLIRSAMARHRKPGLTRTEPAGYSRFNDAHLYIRGSFVSRRSFSLAKASLRSPSLPMLVRELRTELRECQTVLDVGCGNASPLRFLTGGHLTGVDGYAPALEQARTSGTHDDYVLADVKRLSEHFSPQQFDACVALDVIEHLSKEDGWRMAQAMETLARKRVIIFTPNGFIPQHSHEGDLQEHLSGWTADEMRQRGYRVLGMYGPSSLRGEYHHIKYRPAAFWVVVSICGHFLRTRNRPERAAAIFCVKNLQRNSSST